MSDTALHDALTAFADDVDLTDLLPRVDAGLRRRHRRRVALSGLATVLVIVAAIGVAFALGSDGGNRVTPTKPTPSPSPTEHLRGATNSVLPSYVPPGCSSEAHRAHQGFRGAARVRPGSSVSAPSRSWYSLTGRRNADTIPKGGLTATTAGRRGIHPSTGIEVNFVPRANLRGEPLRKILPPPSKFYRRIPVTIAGKHGLLGYDRNEHTATRVDWKDGDGYHSIGCDRLITPQGLSGVGRHQLLRMARSLYR